MSLSVNDLTVEFNSGGYKIRPLNGFSFDSDDGQLVVLLGPSGCGKTTLLSCLAGLLTPASGAIRFGDEEITGLRGRALAAYRRQTVGVVFQAFNLIPSLSARANVMVPLRLSGVSRKDARERATTLLARPPSNLVSVVQTGEIEILREKVDGTEEHVTVIGAGGYFGELGPMLNLPRSASARALRLPWLTPRHPPPDRLRPHQGDSHAAGGVNRCSPVSARKIE